MESYHIDSQGLGVCQQLVRSGGVSLCSRINDQLGRWGGGAELKSVDSFRKTELDYKQRTWRAPRHLFEELRFVRSQKLGIVLVGWKKARWLG